MPVQIGELSTEILAQPEAGSAASQSDTGPQWQETERTRRARIELDNRNARTRARDFDD